MKEQTTLEFGYRTPDGKVRGWWTSTHQRDLAATKVLQDAKNLGVPNYRVDLVQRTVTVTRSHPTTTRSVAA